MYAMWMLLLCRLLSSVDCFFGAGPKLPYLRLLNSLVDLGCGTGTIDGLAEVVVSMISYVWSYSLDDGRSKNPSCSSLGYYSSSPSSSTTSIVMRFTLVISM
jgi:hypothetical protein